MDYQLWARLVIAGAAITLIADRLWPGPDGAAFVLALFFLLIGAGMVPKDQR